MAGYRHSPGERVPPDAPTRPGYVSGSTTGLHVGSTGDVAGYQILSWQDIPSVVKAFDADGRSVSQQLPDWFQQEIDRRAMEQGLIGSDEYLEQWAWSDLQDRPGSAEAVLAEVVSELEQRRGT